MKRSIIQVLLAQGVVLIASLVKSLVLPAVLSIEGFAYWQVYVLYSGFVGVFALGFSDGVYLNYGDRDYNQLPFSQLRGSIRVFIAALIIFSVLACSASYRDPDPDRAFALFFVGIDIAFVCLSGLLLYILQITNQIKSYSIFSISDKVLMLLAILIIVFSVGLPNYRSFIVADCATKLLACIALLIRCKELFIGKGTCAKEALRDYVFEIRSGFGLLIANFTGMLAVNIGRFLVELFGSTVEYASYSFGVSVTNLVLAFVGAVALVLYPNLKRIDEDNLPKMFEKINKGTFVVIALGFSLYAPACIFVNVFFAKYTPMLGYLALMFLSVAGEAKMQLLCGTFYKVLRMEKRLLFVNIASVILFSLVGGVFYLLSKSVPIVAASTAFVLLTRAWYSEWELRNALGIANRKRLLVEVLFCLGFIGLSYLPWNVVALASTALLGLSGALYAGRLGKWHTK